MTWLADNWLDLFGWAGSALLIISLLQTRVLRFRVLNLAACLSLVVFNALVGVWPMVGMNIATSAINLWFIVADDPHPSRRPHLRRAPGRAGRGLPPALPVDPRRRHRRFHPAYAGIEADDLAFQILKGDETVGVVLIRREGDVARVQLDYVTPRFRDFSPGEFVWRRAPRLRDRGFRRVVTPSGMVNPYYDRLDQGFRREGASYVLEL